MIGALNSSNDIDMSKKTALITGITGQDGAYLAELLLGKGYEVHGIKRRAARCSTPTASITCTRTRMSDDQRLVLHYGDLTDSTNLIRIIQQVQPDEIYNLAAQSHVAVSFETPEYTANADAHRHAAPAGGHPHPGAGEEDALLPGLHLASCTAWCRRRRRRKPRRSTRAAPTRWPSCTPTGSR